MTLDYSAKDQVNITMLDYINEILECLGKAEPKSSRTKSSAPPLNLFVVDEDSYKTSKEKLETFRKLIEKNVICYKKSTAVYLYRHLLPDDKSKRSISKRLNEDDTSIQIFQRH